MPIYAHMPIYIYIYIYIYIHVHYSGSFIPRSNTSTITIYFPRFIKSDIDEWLSNIK